MSQPHGTYARAQEHTAQGDEMCIPCKEANRQYMANWRQDPENRRRDRLMTKAADRARRQLAKRHRDEYRDLYRAEYARLSNLSSQRHDGH